MSRSIRMELPSLAKEGWLRPLRKSREASLAGADGHERSECEPDRAKQGRVVRSSHRLSEVERTTPSALFINPTVLPAEVRRSENRERLRFPFWLLAPGFWLLASFPFLVFN